MQNSVELYCQIFFEKKTFKIKGNRNAFRGLREPCRYNKEKDRQKRKIFIQGTIEKDIRKKKEKEDT